MDEGLGSSIFCGREELLLVQTLGFYMQKNLYHIWNTEGQE